MNNDIEINIEDKFMFEKRHYVTLILIACIYEHLHVSIFISCCSTCACAVCATGGHRVASYKAEKVCMKQTKFLIVLKLNKVELVKLQGIRPRPHWGSLQTK